MIFSLFCSFVYLLFWSVFILFKASNSSFLLTFLFPFLIFFPYSKCLSSSACHRAIFHSLCRTLALCMSCCFFHDVSASSSGRSHHDNLVSLIISCVTHWPHLHTLPRWHLTLWVCGLWDACDCVRMCARVCPLYCVCFSTGLCYVSVHVF